jgi:hypothetical protein
MSYYFMDLLDDISKFAVVGAFIFTGITFAVTFWRTRKSEQIKICQDIQNQLKDAESRLLDFSDTDYEILKEGKKVRTIQYLNVWEWFSLLVNENEITHESVLEHFKPNLLRDHEAIFNEYTDLRDNADEFPQFKKLYSKWKP